MKTNRIPYDFNSADFRQAIRGVMEMAATPDRQPLTFGWNEQVTKADGVLDGEGIAFDPAAHVTRTTPPTKVVPAVVEYHNVNSEGTPFGTVSQPRLRITLLDLDYEQVKGADWVEIENERYTYAYDEPPTGLFDVGLHFLNFAHEAEY